MTHETSKLSSGFLQQDHTDASHRGTGSVVLATERISVAMVKEIPTKLGWLKPYKSWDKLNHW